jgi:hypothetical protein
VREAGNFYSQHGRGRALPLIKLWERQTIYICKNGRGGNFH